MNFKVYKLTTPSNKDACKKYNLNPSSICSCCKGKQLTTKGLHWRYYEETFKCQK